MEIREIEAFVQVAIQGSFTRAADVLGTNQPALSRLVRGLEVKLAQTLLVRNGRGATLTRGGETFLVHCKDILGLVQRAKEAMQNLQGAKEQKFTLGLVPHVAKFAIVSLVRHLRLQFPEAAITLVEGTSTMLLESLLIDRIDAAIMYETPRSDLITKRSLLQEELYFIGPARPGVVAVESMRFKDIGRYPLIISSRMHAIRELVEAQASKCQVKLNIALEVDAVTSALDLVQMGYGYALLPLNALKRDERKRKLSVTRITDPTMHCCLIIATARQQAASTFICNALDVLEESVVPMYVAYEQGLSRRFGGARD
jgi:LysR family nitrogen assimilation transcriptional regulator